jgi:hypothetical protein
MYEETPILELTHRCFSCLYEALTTTHRPLIFTLLAVAVAAGASVGFVCTVMYAVSVTCTVVTLTPLGAPSEFADLMVARVVGLGETAAEVVCGVIAADVASSDFAGLMVVSVVDLGETAAEVVAGVVAAGAADDRNGETRRVPPFPSLTVATGAGEAAALSDLEEMDCLTEAVGEGPVMVCTLVMTLVVCVTDTPTVGEPSGASPTGAVVKTPCAETDGEADAAEGDGP